LLLILLSSFHSSFTNQGTNVTSLIVVTSSMMVTPGICFPNAEECTSRLSLKYKSWLPGNQKNCSKEDPNFSRSLTETSSVVNVTISIMTPIS